MKKDNLEFYRVKQAIASFCGFELTKNLVYEEEVEFRYLKVSKKLAQTKEMMQFLNLGETLQFHDLHDTSLIHQKAKMFAVFTGKELRQIYANLKASSLIKSKLELTQFYALKELSDTLFDGKVIMDTIDSKIDHYGEIFDHASSQLASIRKNLKVSQSNIESKLRKFIHDNQDIIMDDLVVERNGRSCVLVQTSQKNKKQGMIHGESASGLAVYFEPQSVVNLNNELNLLIQKEEDEMYKVLKEISNLIIVELDHIKQDFETLQMLDLISAKAKYGLSIDGVIPTIQRESKYFYFKNAANPLIDFKTVVRNTYELKENYNTIIISGSNTGGKTVTLKTIGLFVVMSMCGLALCCEEAILPMYDNLLIDIGDEQSIEQSLSTFSSHIKKMARFCSEIKNNTLILLDELGSGSDPKDSQNLAMAFLDYFRSKQATVLVTTHFAKIKEYAKLHQDILSASVAFDIDKMQPTYRYLEHQSGNSNALLIAQRLGVNSEIIQNAKAYEDKDESEKLIERLDQEYQDLKVMQEAFLQEKEAFKLQMQQQEQAFELQKEKIQEELTKQQLAYNEKINALELEAEQVLSELKTQQVLPKAIHHKKQLEALKIEQPKLEDSTIEIGDYVQITTLNYFGTIEKIQGNNYTVNSNGVKLTTKLKDLKKASKPKEKMRKSHQVTKVSQSVGEVNVIGMNVSEAWSIIDKMLDSAILSNRTSFTIIHGVGTGKLREGIHAHLKKHKHVAKYQLTSNLGATEVLFK